MAPLRNRSNLNRTHSGLPGGGDNDGEGDDSFSVDNLSLPKSRTQKSALRTSVSRRNIKTIINTNNINNNTTIDDEDSMSIDSGTNDRYSIGGSSIGLNNSKNNNRRPSDINNDTTDDFFKDQITKHETSAVFRSKIIVLMILIFATITVAVVCHNYTKQSEIQQYEIQFDGASATITSAFYNIIHQKITNIQSISLVNENMIPSLQQDSQQQSSALTDTIMKSSSWPFITISNFEQRATLIQQLSDSIYMSILPIINDDNRIEWERYTAIASSIWINESLQYQNNNINFLQNNSTATPSTNLTNSTTTTDSTITLPTNTTTNINATSTDTTSITGTSSIYDFQYSNINDRISIFFLSSNNVYFLDPGPQPYFPRWQTSPFINESINENLLRRSNNNIGKTLKYYATAATANDPQSQQQQLSTVLMTPMEYSQSGSMNDINTSTSFYATLRSFFLNNQTYYDGDPLSRMFIPIMTTTNDMNNNNTTFSGVIMAIFDWKQFFTNLLPSSIQGIDVVLNQNSCNNNTDNTSYTYQLNGNDVILKGFGQNYNHRFASMKQSANFSGIHNISSSSSTLHLNQSECYYSIDVYPSQSFYDSYMTSAPFAITFSVTFIFIFTTIMFLIYDRLVERRQRNVLTRAAQSAAIVSSLFPKSVQDRLMQQQQQQYNEKRSNNNNRRGDRISSLNASFSGEKNNHASFNSSVGEKSLRSLDSSNSGNTNKRRRRPKIIRPTLGRQMSGMLGLGRDSQSQRSLNLNSYHHHQNENQQIADLYPHCTVFFADISGFTAWSSTREPEQVFTLLQTVYQTFDALARRRKVFKVETIGDSYVAVTGLPDPQPDHAMIMVKFAYVCRKRFNKMCKKLEITLGPETGELKMKFGLHSGPVTAGVLKGEKARFQLFGDTVNTASRMESTGAANKIQVSKTTANLLTAAGKDNWLTPRKDLVAAKGKGLLQTFWISSGVQTNVISESHQNSSLETIDMGEEDEEKTPMDAEEDALLKQARLIDWMVEMLLSRIKTLVAKRCACKREDSLSSSDIVYTPVEGSTCLDEIKETIPLKQYNSIADDEEMEFISLKVSDKIVDQLRELVSMIALMYNRNPFHNFEHACHVTMSVNRLLKRIVVTSNVDDSTQFTNDDEHDYKYTRGITSDPLALLAIEFSALIHDVDHRGVSNAQLAKEDIVMASLYKNTSIAEQNSLDISWSALMSDRFKELRHFIFNSKEDLIRFRQIIVNVVLATDIFDKELNDLRKARWFNAFSDLNGTTQSKNELKATIVIEHIIQASDVSHTMQHWHVFSKWNRRFFKEMYTAYCQGRLATDPCTFWYDGELGFFDNYVIPLAKKLRDSYVFGVSSEESLSYAESNREEWKERGHEILKSMIDEVVPEVRKQLDLLDES